MAAGCCWISFTAIEKLIVYRGQGGERGVQSLLLRTISPRFTSV